MNAKERYEIAAQVIEMMAEKGYTMQDFAQFVRELSEREEIGIRRRVTRVIQEIGIPAHIKGYYYLIDAICATVEDVTLVNGVTKKLHPMLAKKFETTETALRTNMQRAIERAWDSGNRETFHKYFGFNYMPNTIEFISTIADRFRYD